MTLASTHPAALCAVCDLVAAPTGTSVAKRPVLRVVGSVWWFATSAELGSATFKVLRWWRAPVPVLVGHDYFRSDSHFTIDLIKPAINARGLLLDRKAFQTSRDGAVALIDCPTARSSSPLAPSRSSPQPVPGLLGTAAPVTVTLAAGQTVAIVVDYDTGIR